MKKTKKLASEIRSLEDLIRVNLETLEGVIDGTMDNKKAGIIFTGSRTITGGLKLGLEAMKLGLPSIGGVEIGRLKQLPTDDKGGAA